MKKLSITITFLLICTAILWFKFKPHEEGPKLTNAIQNNDVNRRPSSGDQKARPNKAVSVDTNSNRKIILSGKASSIGSGKIYKKTRTARSLLSTQVFWLKGQKLNIARGYGAVKKQDYHSSMGRKISSVNNHIIIKGKQGLPVIQDPIKMIKGIATGHIIVKAKKNADLQEIAKKYKLKVHHTVPHLNLISFIPEDKGKLLETSAKMADSDLLESVKLDISYGGPRAK